MTNTQAFMHNLLTDHTVKYTYRYCIIEFKLLLNAHLFQEIIFVVCCETFH